MSVTDNLHWQISIFINLYLWLFPDKMESQGLDLPLCLKQTKQKTDKIYFKMGFQTLAIGQWRTVIPEKRETNEVNPVIGPAYFLERVSRALHREGELRESLGNSLSWEDTVSLGRTRQLEFIGHTTRVEKTAQREDLGNLPRVLLEDLIEYRSARVWGK